MFLVPAMACNAPGRLIRPSSGFSAEDLRQTVEAMPLPGTSTPAPGSTPGGGVGANPAHAQAPTPFPTAPGSIYQYETRPGDTLASLARRFGVDPAQIFSPASLNVQGYLPAGTFLTIPDQVGQVSPPQLILPDSELVYSPTARDFNVQALWTRPADTWPGIKNCSRISKVLSGGEIIQRVANELSVNPRLAAGRCSKCAAGGSSTTHRAQPRSATRSGSV